MQAQDSLCYDTARIARYQADSRFDYNSQLVHRKINIYQIIKEWFSELIQKFLGNEFADKYAELILIGLFILFVLFLIYLIYKKRPELFYQERRKNWNYKVDEETIYGVDFDNEISNAVGRGDYQLAVRLVYLQTLKYLSDYKLIDWQTYKTPTEYLYEMKRKEVTEEFRQLTNRFLMVRYGNFEATETTLNSVKELQGIIWKGGSNER